MPQNLVATPGDSQVEISFDAPASTGGFPILNYVVETFLWDDGTPGAPDVSGASSPITVTGLTNGTSYYFRVYAVNINGSGLYAISDQVTL